ncbi:MAG TPA: transglycosylase domain-containing protein [Bacteroidia bacterium]|nr:transglycosylase domain-containing protein [Bacteroidia bacterium]
MNSPVFLFLHMTKKFILFFSILIVLITASYFLFRGMLLENAISKIQSKASEKYQVKLEIKEAHFESLAKIALSEITVIPAKGDTLFYCSNSSFTVSIYRLIKGQPPLNNFLMENGFLKLINYNDSTTNYSFLLKGKSTKIDTTDETTVKNYSRNLLKLWNNFFGLADFNFSISQFGFYWINGEQSENLIVDKGSLNKTHLKVSAFTQQNDTLTGWNMEGTIDPGDEIIDLHVATADSSLGRVPFIEQLSGINFSLNSFGLSLGLNKESANTIRFDINAAAVQTAINHWRISPEDVVFDSVGVRFQIFVNDTAFYSGPESVVIVNQLPLKTILGFSKGSNSMFSANVNTLEMDAGVFFNSLPHGLFSTLEGIKVKGKVEYRLRMNVNMDAPDSLLFESELKKKDFKIVSYGNENYAAINGPFVYSAQEKGRVVRVFTVGPENPMYTPFQEISPVLVSSVLTSEDGTFYFHRGFNEDAFRQSIATNIKEKRFARGGSTISMQLVKNVFLNRNKTISRKVEEAIIVWLIENNRIVSKERMLEVYLNIIEWGPGIYGIGEASRFYFDKKPAQLSLDESIYLASIIPRPKYFKYSFNKDGSLKDYLKNYFQLVAGRLVKKEIITQSDFDQLQYQVQLKGPALQLVLPTDSIPADSLLQEDTEELF